MTAHIPGLIQVLVLKMPTVSKSNRQFVERGKINIFNKQIHDMTPHFICFVQALQLKVEGFNMCMLIDHSYPMMVLSSYTYWQKIQINLILIFTWIIV